MPRPQRYGTVKEDQKATPSYRYNDIRQSGSDDPIVHFIKMAASPMSRDHVFKRNPTCFEYLLDFCCMPPVETRMVISSELSRPDRLQRGGETGKKKMKRGGQAAESVGGDPDAGTGDTASGDTGMGDDDQDQKKKKKGGKSKKKGGKTNKDDDVNCTVGDSDGAEPCTPDDQKNDQKQSEKTKKEKKSVKRGGQGKAKKKGSDEDPDSGDGSADVDDQKQDVDQPKKKTTDASTGDDRANAIMDECVKRKKDPCYDLRKALAEVSKRRERFGPCDFVKQPYPKMPDPVQNPTCTCVCNPGPQMQNMPGAMMQNMCNFGNLGGQFGMKTFNGQRQEIHCARPTSGGHPPTDVVRAGSTNLRRETSSQRRAKVQTLKLLLEAVDPPINPTISMSICAKCGGLHRKGTGIGKRSARALTFNIPDDGRIPPWCFDRDRQTACEPPCQLVSPPPDVVVPYSCFSPCPGPYQPQLDLSQYPPITPEGYKQYRGKYDYPPSMLDYKGYDRPPVMQDIPRKVYCRPLKEYACPPKEYGRYSKDYGRPPSEPGRFLKQYGRPPGLIKQALDDHQVIHTTVLKPLQDLTKQVVDDHQMTHMSAVHPLRRCVNTVLHTAVLLNLLPGLIRLDSVLLQAMVIDDDRSVSDLLRKIAEKGIPVYCDERVKAPKVPPLPRPPVPKDRGMEDDHGGHGRPPSPSRFDQTFFRRPPVDSYERRPSSSTMRQYGASHGRPPQSTSKADKTGFGPSPGDGYLTHMSAVHPLRRCVNTVLHTAVLLNLLPGLIRLDSVLLQAMVMMPVRHLLRK
ncbi:unnamed protein product [Cyprideis torosa]|uniref:Uncharacterized protein n=1 Tax=Cyprideis torosa TaxID=163714 RepID=A0A7R8W7M5_9CRUS|nr:unnamed protein product [Cyprideis torosa]CAG0885359.1 unnamed protein product [Cyprideis torosa]